MKKKVVGIIIAGVCIILCARLAYVKYTEKEIGEDSAKTILVDYGEEKIQEERDEAQWEIKREAMESDLKDLDGIHKVTIRPESYAQYMEFEKVEVDIILQEGYSLNQELEGEIQSYVSVSINCDEVVISTENATD